MSRPVSFLALVLTLVSVPPARPTAPPSSSPQTPAEHEPLLQQARLWQEAIRLRFAPGQRGAAHEAAEQALALERALFGPATPTEIYLLQWLAASYGQERTPAGQARAERYRDEAVIAQRRLLSGRPGQVQAAGRPIRQEVERFSQALAVREKVLGQENWFVGTSLVGLARAREAVGEKTQARASLGEALTCFRSAPAPHERESMLGPWTDAHYHLHRLRLQDDVRAGKLQERLPAELARRLDEAMAQVREAERQEDRTDSVAPPGGKGSPPPGPPETVREKSWAQALQTARTVLWDSGQTCSIRVQLEVAARVRPVFDRYLSFVRRARLPAPKADFSLLKGSVFIQQRRIFLERRHPGLRPVFDVLTQVNEELARLAGSGTEGERVSLLIRKSALEAELGRRWALLPRFQPPPPASQLPDRAVLIDYWTYQDYSTPGKPSPRLACFVSRKGRLAVTYRDLGPLDPITEAAANWRRAIERGRGWPTADPSSPPAILRRLLWEPLAAELAGAELVLISPDGPLCALPFAALPGTKPNSYLIEEMPLAVAPTPLLLNAFRRGKDAPSGITDFLAKRDSPLFATEARPELAGGPLLVGDVEFGNVPGEGDRFPPLPGTAREVADLARRFSALHPDRKATLLTGEKATALAVRRELLRHRWAHLATHGSWSAEGTVGESALPELHSALALAGAGVAKGESGTGLLTALEVSGLDLERAELIVLSACETGLGKVEAGQGVLGLQRAFQGAGALATITTLWQIPDETTPALMGRFYENLWQKKMPRLEALREAQLWMMREGGKHAEVVRGMKRRLPAEERPAPGGRLPPLAWAAFVLSGDWR